MLQNRRIGRRSAIALSSPMRPITADAPVSDVRHQHRSYTNFGSYHSILLKPAFSYLSVMLLLELLIEARLHYLASSTSQQLLTLWIIKFYLTVYT